MPPLTGSRSLESEHEFGAIKQATFERTLKDYRTAITPIEDGEQLDKMRYSTIPSAIESRGQDPYLDKEELVALVTWKLYVLPLHVMISSSLFEACTASPTQN